MSDQKKLSAREYLKQLEVLDMQINDDIATLSDMKMNVCSAGGMITAGTKCRLHL